MYIRHILSIPILFIYSILFHHPVSLVCAFTRKKKEEQGKKKKKNVTGGGRIVKCRPLVDVTRADGGALALGMRERRGYLFIIHPIKNNLNFL